MGIAKTMNAIGEYDFYSLDFDQFIEGLGRMFKVNIHAGFWNNVLVNGVEPQDIEDKTYDLNYSVNYAMHVDIYAYTEIKNHSNAAYYLYELRIPVQMENEDELSLIFYPNGLFQLNFLPFSNYWRFFIEDMIGLSDGYYNSHDEIVAGILKIRECYIEILKNIRCSEVIIWTDAYYQTEEVLLFNQEFNTKCSLAIVKDTMQKLDSIQILPFIEAIHQTIKIPGKRADFTDIAFVDTF